MGAVVLAAVAFPAPINPNSDNKQRQTHNPTSPASSTHSKHTLDQTDDGGHAPAVKKRRYVSRQGKVVDALRQQQQTQRWQHNTQLAIASSSSAASLATRALQSSLNSHLVHGALDTLDFISSAEWHNLQLSLSDLHRLNSNKADAYLETLLACAAALGARTTDHSAITGITKEEAGNMGKEGPSLGRRREAACLALANRAMRLAECGGLLREKSQRASGLTRFMRAIFTSLMPLHADVRTLMLSIHSQLQEKPSRTERETKLFLFYDAFCALSSCQPPVCSDLEVSRLAEVSTVEELVAFNGPTSRREDVESVWLDAAIVAFRRLCALQATTAPLPPAEVEVAFSELAGLADLLQSILPVIVRNCVDHEQRPVNRELAVMTLMTQLEVGIFAQARKHIKPTTRAPQHRTSLANVAQARFVSYVAVLVRTVAKHPSTQRTTHLAANLFMSFEAVPEWTRIVVDAVRHPEEGRKACAGARLTRVDLMTLHEALKQGATVFAALADREQEFAKALQESSREIGMDDGAQGRIEAPREVAKGVIEVGGAQGMVDRALRDILAN